MVFLVPGISHSKSHTGLKLQTERFWRWMRLEMNEDQVSLQAEERCPTEAG